MSRIDHVNIVVSDLQRSIDFYQQALGLRTTFERVLEGRWIESVTGLPGALAHCAFLEAENGDTRLELLHYVVPAGPFVAANSVPNTQGLRHVAFQVEDMDALLARLQAMGVHPVSPPVEVPFSVGTLGRKRLCYFLDPDGVLLEAAAYG